jgi:hypothetical protein
MVILERTLRLILYVVAAAAKPLRVAAIGNPAPMNGTEFYGIAAIMGILKK